MKDRKFKPIAFMEAMERINNGDIERIYFDLNGDYVSAKYCKVDLNINHKKDWYLKLDK